jgi:hypothetical protein
MTDHAACMRWKASLHCHHVVIVVVVIVVVVVVVVVVNFVLALFQEILFFLVLQSVGKQQRRRELERPKVKKAINQTTQKSNRTNPTMNDRAPSTNGKHLYIVVVVVIVIGVAEKNQESKQANKQTNKWVEKSNNQPAHNSKDPANDKDASLLRLMATTAHCSWIFHECSLDFPNRTGVSCVSFLIKINSITFLTAIA